MNLLLQNTDQIEYFTFMDEVFNALSGVCEKYDWLISDIDCSYYPDKRLSGDYALISGHELLMLVIENKIQFNWGVFSALPKGCKPSLSKLPYADGNKELWVNSPKPQLKEAEFEIISWDSSSLLLIGVNNEIGEMFKAHFTDTINLDEFNKQIANHAN